MVGTREREILGNLHKICINPPQAPPGFKRIQSHKSGPRDFEDIQFAQELDSQHLGPIWCMRFSRCGQLLATAGQDTTIRIWVVKDAYKQFRDMRSRYNSKPAPGTAPDSASSSVAAGPTASTSPMDPAGASGSPGHETAVDSTGVLVTSSYDMLDMEGYIDPSEVSEIVGKFGHYNAQCFLCRSVALTCLMSVPSAVSKATLPTF